LPSAENESNFYEILEPKVHETEESIEPIRDINLESTTEHSNPNVGNFSSDVDYGCLEILFCCFTILL